VKSYHLGLSNISAIFFILLALITGQSLAVLTLTSVFYITGVIICFSIEKSNRREGVILFNWVFSSLILFAILHYLHTVGNYSEFAVAWRDEYKFWLISENFSEYTNFAKIFKDSFSLFKFSDLPGYVFYIGTLAYLAEVFFDGNHLLLQFIGTTFWGGMSSILLYKSFLLFFSKKESFKYVICFSLFSVLFAYSFVFLRDIIIAFFYLWVFYIMLKKFRFTGVVKILLIIIIVWQLRFGNALFLLIFLIYYIYNAYKKNKFVLVLSLICAVSLIILLFADIFIQASSTIDKYGSRGQAVGMEVDDSLGKTLYSLPSPIQELAFFMYSQIKPFPSWSSLSKSKDIYSGIVNSLPIIYSVYWFVIVFSLVRMLFINKIYRYIPKHLNLLLIISTVFLFTVTLGASDLRRIMYVYPMIFLVYAVGKGKLELNLNRKIRNEVVIFYLMLNVIYLFLKY